MTAASPGPSSEPFFLGHHLAAMRHEYAHTFAEQAAAFGLDAEGMAKLTLCGMPATVEDLEKIAAYVGMGAETLREMLQVDLLG